MTDAVSLIAPGTADSLRSFPVSLLRSKPFLGDPSLFLHAAIDSLCGLSSPVPLPKDFSLKPSYANNPREEPDGLNPIRLAAAKGAAHAMRRAHALSLSEETFRSRLSSELGVSLTDDDNNNSNNNNSNNDDDTHNQDHICLARHIPAVYTSRSDDIRRAGISACSRVGPGALVDFDWKVAAVVGSSSVADMREPAAMVALDIARGTDNNSTERVMIEMGKEEIEAMIEEMDRIKVAMRKVQS